MLLKKAKCNLNIKMMEKKRKDLKFLVSFPVKRKKEDLIGAKCKQLQIKKQVKL